MPASTLPGPRTSDLGLFSAGWRFLTESPHCIPRLVDASLHIRVGVGPEPDELGVCIERLLPITPRFPETAEGELGDRAVAEALGEPPLEELEPLFAGGGALRERDGELEPHRVLHRRPELALQPAESFPHLPESADGDAGKDIGPSL